MKRRSFLTGLLGAAGLAALPTVVLPTEDEVRRFYSIPSGKVFGGDAPDLRLTYFEKRLLSAFRARHVRREWTIWAGDASDAARLNWAIDRRPIPFEFYRGPIEVVVPRYANLGSV